MEISEKEYTILKAKEAAYYRAVEVQVKWRVNAAMNGMGIYLDLLNELRGALKIQFCAHAVNPDGKCAGCKLPIDTHTKEI